MSFDVAQHLRDGIRAGNWYNRDLCIAAVAMGANLDLGDIANITSGRRPPTEGEYGVLAVTLNEHLSDLGKNHPILSWRDLPRL